MDTFAMGSKWFCLLCKKLCSLWTEFPPKEFASYSVAEGYQNQILDMYLSLIIFSALKNVCFEEITVIFVTILTKTANAVRI